MTFPDGLWGKNRRKKKAWDTQIILTLLSNGLFEEVWCHDLMAGDDE